MMVTMPTSRGSYNNDRATCYPRCTTNGGSLITMTIIMSVPYVDSQQIFNRVGIQGTLLPSPAQGLCPIGYLRKAREPQGGGSPQQLLCPAPTLGRRGPSLGYRSMVARRVGTSPGQSPTMLLTFHPVNSYLALLCSTNIGIWW
jgi:hypothetical protein